MAAREIRIKSFRLNCCARKNKNLNKYDCEEDNIDDDDDSNNNSNDDDDDADGDCMRLNYYDKQIHQIII